jgi:two-component system, LytTR family, response regulator
MRILVVDDEPLARRAVIRAVNELVPDAILEEACDGVEALALVKDRSPDVVFLDVEMPELTGLDVLRHIPEPRPKIIFVTAFAQFAVDAFEHDACDYVVKPFTTERLASSLHRARSEIAGEQRLRALERSLASAGNHLERLALRIGTRVEIIATADVACFSSKEHYTHVHVGARELLCDLSLAHLEERLDPARFARIHRNALVNLARVVRVGADDCLLDNGMIIAVSRRSRSALLARLEGS